jgi:hypothetical protein
MVRHPRVVRPISLESSVRQLPAHVSLWSLASRGIDRPGKRLLVFLRSIWLGIIPLTHSTQHVLIQLGFAHLGGSWGLEAIPSHRTGALADHGVEGIAEHPPRARSSPRTFSKLPASLRYSSTRRTRPWSSSWSQTATALPGKQRFENFPLILPAGVPQSVMPCSPPTSPPRRPGAGG